jgi:hypothetical protein
MKRYVIAGIAAAFMAGGLITGAPPASAGCIDPGWAGHPMAKMCDGPVDDGMWERCMTSFPNGPLNAAESDCYTMSVGDPPKADPVFSTPPTHIDP